MLTHTAGFGYGSADPDLGRWAKHIGRNEEDLQDAVEKWNIPLKFAPGQGWYYGVGLDWAGQLIEKLTNKTLGDFMTENLFQPLGMNDSTFHPDSLSQVQDRLVSTAHRDAETGVLKSGDHPSSTNVSVDGGGAGLYTTAADFAKLLQTLLKALAGEEAVLKQDTVEEMFKPQLTNVQRHELKFLTDSFHEGMVPDFETGMSLDHGIGGVINLEDCPDKRKKGSMMWAGMTNGHWVSVHPHRSLKRPAGFVHHFFAKGETSTKFRAVYRSSVWYRGHFYHQYPATSGCCGDSSLE